MTRLLIVSFVALAATHALTADDAKAKSRDALEKTFIDALTNAVMEGSFSVDGRPNDKAPPKDRYEIESVKKSGGDVWVITARIVYGNVDLKIPVPVEVRWAGDTAVIMLTDVALPGMPGKFSTRLLIDGDRYAGTWSHDKVGGHMWGKITKKPAEPKQDEKK
jgi:hypothetical protein